MWLYTSDWFVFVLILEYALIYWKRGVCVYNYMICVYSFAVWVRVCTDLLCILICVYEMLQFSVWEMVFFRSVSLLNKLRSRAVSYIYLSFNMFIWMCVYSNLLIYWFIYSWYSKMNFFWQVQQSNLSNTVRWFQVQTSASDLVMILFFALVVYICLSCKIVYIC